MSRWWGRTGLLVVGLSLVAVPPASGAGSPEASSGPSASPGPVAVGGGSVLTAEGVQVPTYGVVRLRGAQQEDGAVVTMAVHGVQRVPGGTVVYVSMGYEGGTGRLPSLQVNELTAPGARFAGGGGLSSVRVVDRSAGEVLSTLPAPDDGGPLLRPLATGNTAFPAEPDVMVAAYAVVPELAEGTEVVDVTVAPSQTVVGVPVGEGAWEPAVPGDDPVLLGEGWPEVDQQAVSSSPEPGLSRFPLTSVSQSTGGETTTLESGESVTVDVAADVLFAQDAAELTPQARSVLEDVAAQVRERAVGAAVEVVGHTDAQAGEAYNQDLSQRRARAAADVLGPVVAEAGLELEVEGRGESEPVADNGTEEGRAANRRVSVTFQTAPAEQEGAR